MRPPGNTHAPPWNASFDERRASSVSRPSSPSRSTTTVAAGAATTSGGTSPAAAASRRSSIQRFNGEVALLVTRPQHLLVELAHARLRHLVDERPAFGHLPLGDPLGEER